MSECFDIYRKRGTGCVSKDGYLLVGRNGKQTPEHVIIAEEVLGRPLPAGAVVHHFDNNGLNNSKSNLVICPSQEYHMLLHARQRAYDACGHADWRKCYLCKKYDPLDKLTVRKQPNTASYYHKDCKNEYRRKRRALGLEK